MRVHVAIGGNNPTFENAEAVDIVSRDGRRFEIRETAEGAILFSEIRLEEKQAEIAACAHNVCKPVRTCRG